MLLLVRLFLKLAGNRVTSNGSGGRTVVANNAVVVRLWDAAL